MHVCMTTTHNFCVLGPNTLTPGNTVQTLTLTKFFENQISLHCLFILDFSSLVILSALSYGLVDHKSIGYHSQLLCTSTLFTRGHIVLMVWPNF